MVSETLSNALGTEISVQRAKDLWNTWEIRVLILVSLLIQILLTFLAPLRKCSASSALKTCMWLIYLSTTAIALYIISHISSSPDNATEMVNLLAFWAPFLLLHLGGPDTITALAIEDNELWLRHVLQVIAQVGITLYVFAYSVLRRKSDLLWPTTLMFVNGGIKYFERIQALYYASSDRFRESLVTDPEPGPNYARLMDVYISLTTANIPNEIQGRDDSSSIGLEHNRDDVVKTDEKLVIHAYEFYYIFRGLLVDNFLKLKDLRNCRYFFMKTTTKEAIRIIEIELNLMYDVFYTKAFLVGSKQASLRSLTFFSVIVSLFLFYFLDKENYHVVDVVVTYILLVGAIALDMSTSLMFLLSDWYIILHDKRKKLKRWQTHISSTILTLSRIWRKMASKWRRWSRSISDYNLLRCCFKEPPSIIKYLVLKKIKDALISWSYVKSDNTNVDLVVEFIAEELKKKAKLVLNVDDDGNNNDDNVKVIREVCSARGSLFLEDDYYLISDYLKPWTTDVDYDESLLTWHLATDICHYTRNIDEHHVQDGTKLNDHVLISKKLSDYMTYLLLTQQALVSNVVGMADKRFADTRAEVNKFIACQKLKSSVKNEDVFIDNVCDKLFEVHADVRPVVIKGDRSLSVLFEACRLAKQLKMLGEEKQWEITSKVWFEMLCYAAARSSARSHVAQLIKGGELITLVWLLMAHLGFGERFLQHHGFDLAKLVIRK